MWSLGAWRADLCLLPEAQELRGLWEFGSEGGGLLGGVALDARVERRMWIWP